jgi:hypothetical protein
VTPRHLAPREPPTPATLDHSTRWRQDVTSKYMQMHLS